MEEKGDQRGEKAWEAYIVATLYFVIQLSFI